MTIFEALNFGDQRLKTTLHQKRNGGHLPKLDAQVLLSFALAKPTAYLISHLTDELPEDMFARYERLIERRARHEPVAYLTNEKEFYGRAFYVNPSALIPRPDTETLIEEALKRATPSAIMIDVGTGSGAIAVTVAKETNQPIVATDTSLAALKVAQQNAAAHGVEHLISFEHTPLIEPLTKESFATAPHLLVLANLPYLPNSYRAIMDPDVLDYEPYDALFAGVDGLNAYDALISSIQAHRAALPKRIELILEIDPSQKRTIERLIKDAFPQSSVEFENDLTSRARVAIVTIE